MLAGRMWETVPGEDSVTSNSNRYCLSREEHFEAYKEMFGAENGEWTSRDTLSSADRLRIQTGNIRRRMIDSYILD